MQLPRRRVDAEVPRVGRIGQTVLEVVALLVRRGHRIADVRTHRLVFRDLKRHHVLIEHRSGVGLDLRVVDDRTVGEGQGIVAVGVRDDRPGRGNGIAHRDGLALRDRPGVQIQDEIVRPGAHHHGLHVHRDTIGLDREGAGRGEPARPDVEVVVEGQDESVARYQHHGARQLR